ncbi:secondary thiamine-phosphate synthase enzyme YjbQ [Polycladidibacter stylochi]|uniref:secondary thiamine-phosphate synthase enzyme YjbQ n=1 Tax=Polycladidibacter stylochi TaxID=1807766 RepID=UPI0008352050|nr:secondary thiamine-phosphate synthase enzyme YjbQ [Pseudovibrio stylochi]
MLRQYHWSFSFNTTGQGAYNLTDEVERWLKKQDLTTGLLTVFVSHTSCSLTIQENTDPNVMVDLKNALDRLAPENNTWLHDQEGPDDMPAHIKTSLTNVSLQIPIVKGKMALGIWQALYLLEHRHAAHRRNISLVAMGS